MATGDKGGRAMVIWRDVSSGGWTGGVYTVAYTRPDLGCGAVLYRAGLPPRPAGGPGPDEADRRGREPKGGGR